MRLLLVLAAAAPLVAQNCSTVTAAFEPTSISAGPATGTLVVSAPPGCPWAFTTDADWLRRVSGQLFSGTGVGSASATWTASLNTLPVQRDATVTFGGDQIKPLTFKLAQAAAPYTSITLQPDAATQASSPPAIRTVRVIAVPGGWRWKWIWSRWRRAMGRREPSNSR
jgi:hypothetical protein